MAVLAPGKPGSRPPCRVVSAIPGSLKDAASRHYLGNGWSLPDKRKCILLASQQVIMGMATGSRLLGARKLLIRKQEQICFPERETHTPISGSRMGLGPSAGPRWRTH